MSALAIETVLDITNWVKYLLLLQGFKFSTHNDLPLNRAKPFDLVLNNCVVVCFYQISTNAAIILMIAQTALSAQTQLVLMSASVLTDSLGMVSIALVSLIWTIHKTALMFKTLNVV